MGYRNEDQTCCYLCIVSVTCSSADISSIWTYSLAHSNCSVYVCWINVSKRLNRIEVQKYLGKSECEANLGSWSRRWNLFIKGALGLPWRSNGEDSVLYTRGMGVIHGQGSSTCPEVCQKKRKEKYHPGIQRKNFVPKIYVIHNMCVYVDVCLLVLVLI